MCKGVCAAAEEIKSFGISIHLKKLNYKSSLDFPFTYWYRKKKKKKKGKKKKKAHVVLLYLNYDSIIPVTSTFSTKPEAHHCPKNHGFG